MIIHDDEITTEQYELLIDEQCEIDDRIAAEIAAEIDEKISAKMCDDEKISAEIRMEIRDSVVEVFGGQFSMGVTYYDN